MDTVNKISVLFENCDLIPASAVGFFCDVGNVSLDAYDDTFDGVKYSYGKSESLCLQVPVADTALCKRLLEKNDVVAILLEGDSNASQWVEFPWANYDETENDYQTTSLNDKHVKVQIERIDC